ncbi:hypothetical protein EG831_09225, partial [bacterium]|nr:hypothetical protein [bacterium]
MRRALLPIGVLLATIIVLTQCGKKSNPVAVPESTPAAPTITAAHPASGSTGVVRNTLIYVTFSRPMDHAATEGALAVTGMTGTMSWSNNILIFRPDSLFAAADTVRFTVSTAARDNGGTPLAAAASYSFSCGSNADTTRPAVASHAPAGTGVVPGTEVAAHCSEKLAPWADGAITLRDSASGAAVSGATGISSDSILRFIPSGLAHSTTYIATVGTACVDRCGNAIATPYSWTFTTAADNIPPTVHGTSPGNGDTLVSVNAQVRVRFSEPMDTAATRTATTHSELMHYRTEWSGDTLMTLTMTDTLSFHLAHIMTVGTGATDKAGNHLSSAYSFSFTTARGLYVACRTAGDMRFFQAHDLKPEGVMPSLTGVTQTVMATAGTFALLLASDGVHYLDVHAQNHAVLFAPFSGNGYGLALSRNTNWNAVSDTIGDRVYLFDGVLTNYDTILTGGAAPKGLVFSANNRYLY